MQNNIIKEAIELRKHLHANPELSCEEQETSNHLKKLIRATCQFDELVEFENYGFAVTFNGASSGKKLLIRADFDALPIQEINDFDHKSKKNGVSHKCGHDGHASILYALARQLSEEGLSKGEVTLVFQPAEENGEGAKGIVNDPKFEGFQPDYVIALHNLPGYPLHSIVIKEGPFTAAANSIIIKLEGKTSHAAEPELGVNPATAIAQIVQEILSTNHPELADDDFKIATPIYMTMGEKAYGVSAGYGEIHFTLRAWSNEVMEEFEQECEEIAHEIGERHGLKVTTRWTEKFFANINEPIIVDAIRSSARTADLQIFERETPFKWGEDFGLFTEQFPGAMFGIGAGVDSPALHNPDYDFPDELIKTASDMFYSIIHKLQQ